MLIAWISLSYPGVWSAMCVVEGIEMSACGLAAISDVSELMNMETVNPRRQSVNQS